MISQTNSCAERHDYREIVYNVSLLGVVRVLMGIGLGITGTTTTRAKPSPKKKLKFLER